MIFCLVLVQGEVDKPQPAPQDKSSALEDLSTSELDYENFTDSSENDEKSVFEGLDRNDPVFANATSEEIA